MKRHFVFRPSFISIQSQYKCSYVHISRQPNWTVIPPLKVTKLGRQEASLGAYMTRVLSVKHPSLQSKTEPELCQGWPASPRGCRGAPLPWDNNSVEYTIGLATNIAYKRPLNLFRCENNFTNTKNIARIAKRCPENISSVIKVSKCSY